MGCLHYSTLQCTIVHCGAFLVGGLKRAPQIFFLNFFVWVVLFGHNYGPVNQKITHQNFSCRVGKSTSICAIDLAVQHICRFHNFNNYIIISSDRSSYSDVVLVYMLKCKINSTNGGTFSNFAGKILVRFFLVHRAIIMSK